MESIQDYCPPPACPSGDVFGGLSTAPFTPSAPSAATDAATPGAVAAVAVAAVAVAAVAAAAPPIFPLIPTIQNEPSSITGPGYVLPPPHFFPSQEVASTVGQNPPQYDPLLLPSHSPMPSQNVSMIVIVTGNPGVFRGYPYPYPSKPVPTPRVRVFSR